MTCDSMTVRLWKIASYYASEAQRWQMRLFVMKARESECEEMRMQFMHRFHLLAERIIAASLGVEPLNLLQA